MQGGRQENKRNAMAYLGLSVLIIRLIIHAVRRSDESSASYERSRTGPSLPDYVTRQESTMRWEPYKIAIGAFYAICVQRMFETSINSFTDNPPRWSLRISEFSMPIDDSQSLVILQLLAFVIWLGLYYINNVRIYFMIVDDKAFARIVTHIVLSLALGLFYFLGATVGRPSQNQVTIILAILAVDTVFPLLVGTTLSAKRRFVWVGRGLLQCSFVLGILLIFKQSQYDDLIWSALLLLVMLIQLLVVVPLDFFVIRQRRQLSR